MKKKIRLFILSCVTTILGLVLLLSPVLQAQESVDLADAWDFGKNNVESNQTVLPSVLWERLFGEAPTAEEQAYLDGASGIAFTYNSTVPDSIVETAYDGNLGVLSVSLPSYSYTAANGMTVTWIPQVARLEGNDRSFTCAQGQYTCQFENVLYSGDFEVEVDFAWSVELSAQAVDTFLTAPYTAAQAALEEILAHEDIVAAYNAEMGKFLAYEAYREARKKYDTYINVDLPAYEADMKRYEPFRIANEQYQADLTAYEAWRQYWAYQEFMSDDVQTKYLAYQAYLEELAPIEDRLDILEALFVTDSHGWQLYKSLMGGTVEQVLSEKDKLIDYRKEFKTYINNAEQSTQILRPLMKEYYTLRKAKYASDHARLSALYSFYTTNYSTLSKHFAQLYGALNSMGSDSAVVMALSERGHLEHYYQFVGQLYITQVCLNDSEPLNTKTVICGQILDQVVEPIQMVSDRTSSPNGVVMPATEVPKVEKVEQIDEPSFDVIHERPILETYVNRVLQGNDEWKDWEYADLITVEPTAPPVVDEPTPVDEASHPGNAPADLQMHSALRAIADKLRKDELPKHTPQEQDRTLTFAKTVTCPVSISNLKTVTFYSADGQTVLDRQTLEYGATVSYQGPDTARESDAQYHYEFRAWVLSDGTAAEMVATSNMSLYAYYQKTTRFYDVTWVLDGQTEVRRLAYGQMPVSPFVTVKEPDTMNTYTFSGWDHEIAPVTGDVTYTGSFVASPRTYTVTWQLADRVEHIILPYGSMPSYEGDTSRAPDNYRYTFIGWNTLPTAVTSDVTYTATYSREPLAQDTSGTILNVKHYPDTIIVTTAADRVDIRAAAELAVSQQKTLTVRWSDFHLTYSPDQLPLMLDSYCRQIGVIQTTQTEQGTVYRVGYLNSAGMPLQMSLGATVQIVTERGDERQRGYLMNGDTWEKLTESTATVTGDTYLRICRVYSLEVLSEQRYDLNRFPTVYEQGETVDLTLIGCVFGYEIAGAELVFSDGTRVKVDGMRFEMPQESVKLELVIEKIIYRVSFVVDGVTVHTAEYAMGERILPPDNPKKASDGQYSYRFEKWSPSVGIAYGDVRDIVFEAVFASTAIRNDDFTPDRSLFKNVLAIAIAAVVLLSGAVTLTVILVRKKKKKAARCAVQEESTVAVPEVDASQSAEPSEPEETAQAETDPATETETGENSNETESTDL